MRRLIFVLLLFAFFAPLFAQPVAIPWWLSFEQGKQQFRSNSASEITAAL